VDPRAGLDRCGKSPHRDSIPGPSSPLPVAVLTELPGPWKDKLEAKESVRIIKKLLPAKPVLGCAVGALVR